MTPGQSLVLKMLKRAAKLGEPCPTNQQIADMLGTNSVSAASAMLKRLEEMDKIRLERFQCARVVTIMSTGQKTASKGGSETPHWRAVSKPMPVPRKYVPRVSPAPELKPPEPMVARDPCWRCGVRGDIGCEHRLA